MVNYITSFGLALWIKVHLAVLHPFGKLSSIKTLEFKYAEILGAFHSTKTSGLSFQLLSVANGTAFSKMSEEEDKLARCTRVFEFFSRRFYSTFLLEFLEFSVEWFAFRKFISPRNF